MQCKKIRVFQVGALALCLCLTLTALGETLPPYPDGCDDPNETPAPPYDHVGQPTQTVIKETSIPTSTPEAEEQELWKQTPDPGEHLLRISAGLGEKLHTPLPTLPPLPTAEPETSAYEQLFGVTEEELVLAARVAYLEAGSKENGIRAVLSVIYNRCMAPRFGGEATTIETEVFRKGQFSVVHHKRFDKIEPPEAYVEIAREIFYEGKLYLPKNILFFCARRLGKSWGGRKFYKDIGGNLFFYGSTE